MRAFQPGHVSQPVIMVKYLATLEQLAPRFGTERVLVCRLEEQAQAVGDPCYVQDGGQSPPEPGPELAPGPPTHEVLVTGTGGIRWRPVQAEVSRVPLPSRGPDGWGWASCSALASKGGCREPFPHVALGCVCLSPGVDFWGAASVSPLGTYFLRSASLRDSRLVPGGERARLPLSSSLRFCLLACVSLGGRSPSHL